MNNDSKSIIDEWKKVADKLSIDIETNWAINVDSKNKIYPVLVKNFGHTIGMLVVEKYNFIKDNRDHLVKMGYGYSVLPFDNQEIFDLEEYKKILCDWGWTGPEIDTPEWYEEPFE